MLMLIAMVILLNLKLTYILILKVKGLMGVMWRPTDAIEIRALIGAYIHLGAMNQNIFPSELIWDVRNGNQLMRCTFSRNRFLKLGNMLHFDDKATRTERGMFLHHSRCMGEISQHPKDALQPWPICHGG